MLKGFSSGADLHHPEEPMKLTSTTKRVAVGLLAAALPLSMAACSKGASSSTGGAGGELTMWTHNAGNKAELAAITNIVNDYNASQKKYKVKIQAFPQDSYNQSVGRGCGVQEAALHPRHRRPQRAELGVGRLPGAARRHGGDAVEVPADGARQVGQQDVLLRLLRRRARHGDAQVRSSTSTASASRRPSSPGRRTSSPRR